MEGESELAALEAARQLKAPFGDQPDQSSAQRNLGQGFIVALILAFLTDVVEIIGTITGFGIPFVWIGGLIVDFIVYGSLGATGKLRNQSKKVLLGLVGENVPVFSSALEFFPFRTFSLYLIYRSSNKAGKGEQ